MNRIALVTVGDELLNGAVVDTSTAWLGDQLALEGHALVISISVQDELSAISDAILSAIARADAVIVTGGLGPTSDDLTRLGVARAARVEVAQRKELVELITARYAARNMQVPSQALVMADIPIGASALTNNGGSAPGIFMELDNVPLFALPGVPHEMRDMFVNEVLPELRQRFLGVRQHTFIVRVALLGESAISESLRDWESNLPPGVSVAYLASLGDVEVKISSQSARQAEEGARLAADLIGDSVYAIDEARALRTTLASAVLHLMREQDETLATVESLTGGGLAQLLTDIPGASEVYLGGAVTYQAASKHELADVPEEMMNTLGTVNAQVAKAMARGIRLRLDASWALATTGVAGPGDFEGHPAGTLYVGVSSPAGERAFKVVLSGQMADDRARVRRASAAHALDLFRRSLAGLPMGTKAGVITEE
ncbi:MAG: CinA family nicotinamide mononucleotide deamidase-related protein [Actinobacteria bacterium]|nr:CinA family nicotinamide mononucleotide deamidase-related protein [Actinomycetota bacterium]